MKFLLNEILALAPGPGRGGGRRTKKRSPTTDKQIDKQTCEVRAISASGWSWIELGLARAWAELSNYFIDNGVDQIGPNFPFSCWNLTRL